MRAAILLVEGSMEEILYTVILRKLYRAGEERCEDINQELKDLIDPLARRRIKCYTLENGMPIVLINSGGHDNLTGYIRQLLKRREIIDLARKLELYIVIAADRDRRPYKSIRDLLASMGYQVTGNRIMKIVLEGDTELFICVIEQGEGEGSSTGEIEDHLQKLFEMLRPEFIRILKEINNAHGSLTDKQKLLIYLALMREKPKIRALREEIKEILEATDNEILRKSLSKIIEILDRILIESSANHISPP